MLLVATRGKGRCGVGRAGPSHLLKRTLFNRLIQNVNSNKIHYKSWSFNNTHTIFKSYYSQNLEHALNLTIANPANLLNNIAHRYASTSRILMEFVDNPLDDAEALYRSHGHTYPYPITISVQIDPKSKTLTISDNCSGMTYQQMQNIVQNVGESTKKGVSWLNGQFGFGVHSFRAAASHLRIISKKKGEGPWVISLDRHQATGILPPSLFQGDVSLEESGTEVTLSGFDSYWWKDISLDSMATEIEQHFERLLTRPNLSVFVKEVIGNTIIRERKCVPFDYTQVKGSPFSKTIQVTDEDKQPHDIKVEIIVSQTDTKTHKVRFFSLGRRIGEVALIPSFMKASPNSRALWAHPLLVGYIDVGNVLDPVITRDEFRRSKTRAELYEKLTEIEDELRKQLDVELERQRDLTFTNLGDVLEGVLDKIHEEDKRETRKQEREKQNAFKEAVKQAEKAQAETQVQPSTESDIQHHPETSPSTPSISPSASSSTSSTTPSSTSSSPLPDSSPNPTQSDSTHTGGVIFENPSDSDHTQHIEVDIVDSTTQKEQSPTLQDATPAPPAIPTDSSQAENVNSTELKAAVQSGVDAEVVGVQQELTPTAPTEASPSNTPAETSSTSASPSQTAASTGPQKPKKSKVSGYQINFVSIAESESGFIPRSHMYSDTIDINTKHPDFIKRIKTKYGRPKFTETLGTYLAMIISAHYNNDRYTKKGMEPPREQVYDDLIGLTSRFELALKRKIPQIQKTLAETMTEEEIENLEEESIKE